MASSFVLHKSLSSPIKVVSASGSYIWLENGNQVLDACSGVGVSCFGYQDEQVAKAIEAQLTTVPYAYSSAFSTETSEKLANEILQDRPGGLSKAAFFCSGSEATEAALKIAIQFWQEKGTMRTKFISRKHSYHGSTLGALSVSGHMDRRAPYTNWLSNNVSFVDTCYPFRGKAEDITEGEYVEALKNQLENEFQRLGPGNVAGFIAETIPGTALGCVPACKGYFRAVREVCDKYEALLILDEVLCGMGRTGSYHAWQQEDGFEGPDLQIVSKSLGGGFVPLSAVLVHEKIINIIKEGSGTLNHSQTFQAHPIACAAALEVQRKLKRESTTLHVQEMGRFLGGTMKEVILPLSLVGDVRGRGLLWAVEFVTDKKTKGQFPAHSNFSKRVLEAALKNGLYIHGTSGCSGPFNVQYVMIAPWYLVTKAEIRLIVDKLKRSIEMVNKRVT